MGTQGVKDDAARATCDLTEDPALHTFVVGALTTMIKYIGSKRTLLTDLVTLTLSLPEFTSAIDLFSGTSRVGHALKRAGLRVESNDHNAYAHTLATCYVEADREAIAGDAELLLRELNGLQGSPGYFTETFCVQSRFFQPHNGERVDSIREAIEAKHLPPILKAVLLVSLMEAADRVDSTCGLQMAYVKQWAARSYKPLELRLPAMLPRVAHGPCHAHRLDALEAATSLIADIAYVDPPYNQHSYLSNYHIWETLVLWDKPETYGIARKRVDCRTRKSPFNSRVEHQRAFGALVDALQCALIIVSFNNEGFQSRTDLERTLARRGTVHVIAKDFKRYVGAQIGIFNPSGERVGKVSHLRNQELLYLVATERCPNRPDIDARLAKLAAAAEFLASEGRGLSPG